MTRTGADIRHSVEITLEEAFAGTMVNLCVPTRVTCEACKGTGGGNEDRSSDLCPSCHGVGTVQYQQVVFVFERSCSTCRGRRMVIRNPCRVCRGAGTVPCERSLEAAIPAGIESGVRIRLAGEGEAGGQGRRTATCTCTSASTHMKSFGATAPISSCGSLSA